MTDETRVSVQRAGQWVGVLLFLQFVAGLTLPFILLRPGIIGYPTFLTAAAEHAPVIRSAVLIALAGGALTVGVALAALPVFRRHGHATAYALLAVCTISCTLDLVHNAAVLSMLSLSQRFVEAGAPDAGPYQALGAVVASARKWAHTTQLVGIGAWIILFYSSLWRFRLVPRALALLGLVGILLQFSGVTLPMLLGRAPETRLAMPLAPIQLSVALWLLFKGFSGASPADPERGE